MIYRRLACRDLSCLTVLRFYRTTHACAVLDVVTLLVRPSVIRMLLWQNGRTYCIYFGAKWKVNRSSFLKSTVVGSWLKICSQIYSPLSKTPTSTYFCSYCLSHKRQWKSTIIANTTFQWADEETCTLINDVALKRYSLGLQYTPLVIQSKTHRKWSKACFSQL